LEEATIATSIMEGNGSTAKSKKRGGMLNENSPEILVALKNSTHQKKGITGGGRCRSAPEPWSEKKNGVIGQTGGKRWENDEGRGFVTQTSDQKGRTPKGWGRGINFLGGGCRWPPAKNRRNTIKGKAVVNGERE